MKFLRFFILKFIAKFSPAISYNLSKGIYMIYLRKLYHIVIKYLLSFLPKINILEYREKSYAYVEEIFK